MLGRLSIVLVTAFFFSAAVRADSISLQHNPTLNTQRHVLRMTAKFDTVSRVIIGDLGRGFSSAERRSLLQVKDREFFADNVPRGKLVTYEPGQLNFGFLGSSRQRGTLDTFTHQVWRFLFHPAPKGSRGRREQAESGIR